MYPIEGSVIATQSTNTDQAIECPGQWFVSGLVPRALSIAKPKRQSGAALCLQNRSITFVPKTFKKMIFRPSAGPIPGGDFTQQDLG